MNEEINMTTKTRFPVQQMQCAMRRTRTEIKEGSKIMTVPSNSRRMALAPSKRRLGLFALLIAMSAPIPEKNVMAEDMSFAEAQAITADFQQWMIGSNVSGFVLTKSSFDGPVDRSYNLKGLKLRKFLQWEDQTFGINLGWTDNASAETSRKVSRWFFARHPSNRETGPIVYGETIAIGYGVSPSFVKYAHRDIGVNLKFVGEPAFEWKILGGQPGQAVRTGRDWVILYNITEGQPLIYFKRDAGGHLGWPDSISWRERAEGWLRNQVNKAGENAGKAAMAALGGG
jgi:hypothetical protein